MAGYFLFVLTAVWLLHWWFMLPETILWLFAVTSPCTHEWVGNSITCIIITSEIAGSISSCRRCDKRGASARGRRPARELVESMCVWEKHCRALLILTPDELGFRLLGSFQQSIWSFNRHWNHERNYLMIHNSLFHRKKVSVINTSLKHCIFSKYWVGRTLVPKVL